MEEPVVTTKYGHLRGTKERNFDGGTYFAFKGIPYAKPPIGNLRFADPEPPAAWVGIRDAAEHGDNCAQRSRIMRNICGSEDCLHLNVYTNSIHPAISCPVMVWIHGGAFIFGSGDSDMFSPDYLLKHNVVIVSINYRLGVLGFLNLEDTRAPGNQGLKDQVMALEWIRSNISSFGGDPNNVTIFGESAGGASVHYLALSPLAQGLFHKAISQSGVCINPWAYHDDPKQYAYRLCDILGLKSRDPKTIVDFLRQIDFVTLIEAQEKILSTWERHAMLYPFGPGVDGQSNKPFMPLHPSVLVQCLVRVPFLIGYNDMEGSITVAGKTEKDYKVINSNFRELLHPRIRRQLAEDRISATDLKRHYYGDADVTIQNVKIYAEMTTDLYFKNDILHIWQLQSRSRSPTFCYKFTYDKDISFLKSVFNIQHLPGACHTDELDFLFHQPIRSLLNLDYPKPASSAYKLVKIMTKMWTDFAKTGEPTPEICDAITARWPSIEPTKIHYLEINEKLEVSSMPASFKQVAKKSDTWSKL